LSTSGSSSLAVTIGVFDVDDLCVRPGACEAHGATPVIVSGGFPPLLFDHGATPVIVKGGALDFGGLMGGGNMECLIGL
jgi:hypothetical protein